VSAPSGGLDMLVTGLDQVDLARLTHAKRAASKLPPSSSL